jgi:predicted DCC family thiol-disulfide oxidoreductase YuxK
MPEVSKTAYSYRDDRAVPPFDDGRALFVFDGVCVLCSSGTRRFMNADKHGRMNFTSMQKELGQALYKHYGVVPDESYLVLISGHAYTNSRGYLEICKLLGGAWRLLGFVVALLPERLRDWVYAAIARNRYRWFGRVEFCSLMTEAQKTRLL